MIHTPTALLTELDIPIGSRISFLRVIKRHTGIVPIKINGKSAGFSSKDWKILIEQGKELYDLHLQVTEEKEKSQAIENRSNGLYSRLTPYGGLYVQFLRAERPDKWTMDRLIKGAEKLEADYKDAIKAIDLMIIDHDAFHDKNVELEKKLEIAVEALYKIDASNMNIDMINDITDEALTHLKGDQNEM